MRMLYHPAREELRLSACLYALGDPIRLGMIRQLAASPADMPCGAFETAVAKSTASHHFKVLREAGITRVRIEGKQRLMCLRRDDLEARFPGLLRAILEATEPL